MNMTREQARQLSQVLQPRIGFIVTVRERMDRAAMSSDPLYKPLLTAEHVLRDFGMALHYRSCAMGVGEKPADSDSLQAT
jgi:hypothetical protein